MANTLQKCQGPKRTRQMGEEFKNKGDWRPKATPDPGWNPFAIKSIVKTMGKFEQGLKINNDVIVVLIS